ncbi:MAG TPA: S8 family serine peptidase [bacterium]|nr:S8 family serine peptidase [bacterium]
MRKNLKFLALLALLAPGFLGAHPLPLSLKDKALYVPGEVLVALKEEASPQSRARALGLAGSAQGLSRAGFYKINLHPGASVEAALAQLQAEPAVKSAQPNYYYYALGCSNPPTDPYYVGSSSIIQTAAYWPFQKISAPAAWSTFCAQYTSGSVTVAVIDSGVDFSNSDLPASVMVPGINTSNSVSSPVTNAITNDDFGHGTFVASLIATQWDGAGMAGLAGMPGVVKIMPVKVLDNRGEGTTESIVDGMDYAFQQGARLLNLSLGGPSDGFEQAEIQFLLANNCVVVAAAGNESSALDYPAGYPGVVAVGATDENNQPTFYSNFGQGLDLMAPGGAAVSFVHDPPIYDPNSDILGLLTAATTIFVRSPDSHYGTGAGTSFSTPLVTGAAALLWALNPGLTGLQVVNRLINSADSLNGNRGWDPHTGYGLLDVNRVLQPNGAQVSAYLNTFNSPNPFSLQRDVTTNITLAISQPEPVELVIRDGAGHEVLRKDYQPSQLNNNPDNPQFKSYYVAWDGRNGSGNLVAPGVYFYSVSAGGVTGRNKIVVLKGFYTGPR